MFFDFIQHILLPVALAATAPAPAPAAEPSSLAEATNAMAENTPGLIDACLKYQTTGEQCWQFFKTPNPISMIQHCQQALIPVNECLNFAQIAADQKAALKVEADRVIASRTAAAATPAGRLGFLLPFADVLSGLAQPLILLVGGLAAAWLKRHADQTADLNKRKLLLDMGTAIAASAGRGAGLAKDMLDDMAKHHGDVTATDKAAAVSAGVSYVMRSYRPEIEAVGKDPEHIADMVRGELGRLPSQAAPAAVEVKPTPGPADEQTPAGSPSRAAAAAAAGMVPRGVAPVPKMPVSVLGNDLRHAPPTS